MLRSAKPAADVLVTDLTYQLTLVAGRHIPYSSVLNAARREGELIKDADNRNRVRPEFAAMVKANMAAAGCLTRRRYP